VTLKGGALVIEPCTGDASQQWVLPLTGNKGLITNTANNLRSCLTPSKGECVLTPSIQR
jgi:hypothetical protein